MFVIFGTEILASMMSFNGTLNKKLMTAINKSSTTAKWTPAMVKTALVAFGLNNKLLNCPHCKCK